MCSAKSHFIKWNDMTKNIGHRNRIIGFWKNVQLKSPNLIDEKKHIVLWLECKQYYTNLPRKQNDWNM